MCSILGLTTDLTKYPDLETQDKPDVIKRQMLLSSLLWLRSWAMQLNRFQILTFSALLIQSLWHTSSLAQGITDKTVMIFDGCSPVRPVPQIRDNRNGRIHAVGIYHGHVPGSDDPRQRARSLSHPVGDVEVVVSPKPKPIILLLCSYDPVRWNVQVQPGAKVEKIILSGYHNQEIVGAARAIPVLMTSYTGAAAWGPNVQIGGFDYFWVNERFDPNKDERHHHFEVTNWAKLFTLMQKLYGKPEIDTFQGAREGIRFFI